MAKLKVDGAIFQGGDNLYNGNLQDVPTRARLLEAAGYDGVFTLDTNIDPFMVLLLAAEHTQRIELMTGVAIAFARSPMTLAMQAWNLQNFSQGRMILGLGSQVKAHIENRFSMPWIAPAERMRELILAIRAIWNCWGRGEPLNFRGKHYKHTLMTPVFNPGPIAYADPKIYLGALGPKMIEVAGEVADGLYGHPFSTMKFIQEIQLPSLRIGLEKARKHFENFNMPAMIITITGRNADEMAAADFAMRKLLAFYGSTPAYYPVLELHGWGDVGRRLNMLSKAGQWNAMAVLFTEEMVQAFAVKGRPEEIPDLIAERCKGLVDRVTLYAPYTSDASMWPNIVKGIQAHEGKNVQF